MFLDFKNLIISLLLLENTSKTQYKPRQTT
uniref:Uncharacterized protein n=1 Tax=Populus trichocarpa TaxID=3694 RepID=A0A3N7GDA9_POPTR